MKIAIVNVNKENMSKIVGLKPTVIHIFIKDIIGDFSNYSFLDCVSILNEKNIFFIFDAPKEVSTSSVSSSNVSYLGYDKVIV